MKLKEQKINNKEFNDQQNTSISSYKMQDRRKFFYGGGGGWWEAE